MKVKYSDFLKVLELLKQDGLITQDFRCKIDGFAYTEPKWVFLSPLPHMVKTIPILVSKSGIHWYQSESIYGVDFYENFKKFYKKIKRFEKEFSNVVEKGEIK